MSDVCHFVPGLYFCRRTCLAECTNLGHNSEVFVIEGS